MKAAILQEQGIMTYEEVPTPLPAPGNLLMQVKSVSICGSDIKRYKTGSNRVHPIILGHECGGIIESVGEGVDEELIGKRASIIPLVPCFECIQCQHGYFSACPNYSFIGSRQSGGFADYVELPVRNALVMPDDLSFEYAALIEPSTIARSTLYKGDFSAGQTALVFGVGSIGLLVVQWLRILGAKTIICVDISDENLETAREMGAHVTLNPMRDDVASEVAKLTKWGVDVSIEVAGAPQTLEQTVQVTRPHGKVVLAGNQPLDKSIPLSFIENMIRRELDIVGNHMSFSSPFPGPAWTDSVAALANGSLNMDALISHRFSLAEAPEVFAKIGEGTLKHRKIMLQPE
jgi:L-iditol 2-dehydrogenase